MEIYKNRFSNHKIVKSYTFSSGKLNNQSPINNMWELLELKGIQIVKNYISLEEKVIELWNMQEFCTRQGWTLDNKIKEKYEKTLKEYNKLYNIKSLIYSSWSLFQDKKLLFPYIFKNNIRQSKITFRKLHHCKNRIFSKGE